MEGARFPISGRNLPRVGPFSLLFLQEYIPTTAGAALFRFFDSAKFPFPFFRAFPLQNIFSLRHENAPSSHEIYSALSFVRTSLHPLVACPSPSFAWDASWKDCSPQLERDVPSFRSSLSFPTSERIRVYAGEQFLPARRARTSSEESRFIPLPERPFYSSLSRSRFSLQMLSPTSLVARI